MQLPPLDLLDATRHPLAVVLRMTAPQTIPPGVWTALTWGEALADNYAGWGHDHPERYGPRPDDDGRDRPGFYGASLHPLRITDLEAGILSLGVLVDGNADPGAVAHQAFAGQDPEDRRRKRPPQVVEVPHTAMFRLDRGCSCAMGVRHTFPAGLMVGSADEPLTWSVQYLTA